MKNNTFRREKLIYSATPNTDPIRDLVTGKGELTKEDMWADISNLLEVGHWATNRQIQLWIRDFSTDRYSTLEKLLKSKVDRGDLRMDHYGKPKVYAKPIKTRGAPKKYRPYLYHEISCMECYIRFQKSKRGVAIPAGDFRGFGVLPDFKIKYPSSIVLGEFENRIDLNQHKRLEGKLAAYRDHLHEIKTAFNMIPVVVFILDIPREDVRQKIEECNPESQIYFCDYETFKAQYEVVDGMVRFNVLDSEIYFYSDGKEYSLTK
jgi:hypothetical protein